MVALASTVGAYAGVESLKLAINDSTTQYDALILEHLCAASRDVEQWLRRRFVPYTGTNTYRWPPLHVAYSWEVWTEDDLLSVSAIEVAAGGQNATPVAVTNYFLEPQQYGPPYNRVEVDLSSTDVFQAGSTPQRSVQISGQWGYCSVTVAAGTLGAAVASTTQATITVSLPTTINQGDVLLIDSEALFVDASPQLSSGVLNVWRGVNGTTAATHANGAAVSRYQAPSDIRRLVRADAIANFTRERAGWAPTIGAEQGVADFASKTIQTLRQRVEREYKRARVAAV